MVKYLNRSSPDLFDRILIIIFMGDFHQFPPVKGPVLWMEPRPENNEDVDDQIIWH